MLIITVTKKMTKLGEHGIVLCNFTDTLSTWIDSVFSRKYIKHIYNSVAFFYTENTRKCVVFSLHVNHKFVKYENIDSVISSKHLKNYCIKNLNSESKALASDDTSAFDSAIRLTKKNHTVIKLSDIFINEVKRCVSISDKLSILQVNGDDILNAIIEQTKQCGFDNIFQAPILVSKNIPFTKTTDDIDQRIIAKKLLLVAESSNNQSISNCCFDYFTKSELLSLLHYFEDAKYDGSNIIKNKIVKSLSKIDNID